MNHDQADATEERITRSFRSFREALVTKHFQNHDNKPIQVIPRLYVGSFGAAIDKEVLLECGVTHIICASSSLPLKFPECFQYLRLDIADDARESISNHFSDAISFIESGLANGSVLVHCFAGKSRSITIVIAYLIASKDYSFEEALALVRQNRPQAQPNRGFIQQLITFEKNNRQNETCN